MRSAARQSQGYIPLVRASAPLTGIPVARKDGPVGKMSDLDGKELAFPHRTHSAHRFTCVRCCGKTRNPYRAALCEDTQQCLPRPYSPAMCRRVAPSIITLAQESAAVRDQLRVFEDTCRSVASAGCTSAGPESVRRGSPTQSSGSRARQMGRRCWSPSSSRLRSPPTTRDYLPLERLILAPISSAASSLMPSSLLFPPVPRRLSVQLALLVSLLFMVTVFVQTSYNAAEQTISSSASRAFGTDARAGEEPCRRSFRSVHAVGLHNA